MKQEQNADHLEYAVDLCEMWCRDIPVELQKQKQALIRIMGADYLEDMLIFTRLVRPIFLICRSSATLERRVSL